ncbi:MAG: protoporphyrinogen oxidase [Micrococcales bacterium]|nr:protoporphyrinogen oxidase [Micrococcales bacterium]
MGARVAVVGGGISGLAAAWELSRAAQDLTISVLEGAERVGGKLRLAEVAGHLVDVGPESVLARRPEALTLICELGLATEVIHPAPVGASIVSRGRRWPMPRGTLMGVPSDPDSVRGLLTDAEVGRLIAETLTPPIHHDVPLGAFIEQRLGAAVTDRIVEPLLAGVYAGHSRSLSLEMAVPALHRAARDGIPVLEAARAAAAAASDARGPDTPVFASLRSGVGSLPLALTRRLRERGVEVRTGTTVRELRAVDGGWVLVSGPTIDEVEELFDAVVLATPAAPTARLLRTVAPRAAQALASIEYASVAIVTIAIDSSRGELAALADSSGFLVPPAESLTIKAATFTSTKWPALHEHFPETTFVRASIGRHREEATLQRPDEELAAAALADLATVLGQPLPDPVAVHVQRWGGGLPQYAVGHRLVVDRARAGLVPGLGLGGAAYDGVGIPACVGSGRAAARRVLAHLPD